MLEHKLLQQIANDAAASRKARTPQGPGLRPIEREAVRRVLPQVFDVHNLTHPPERAVFQPGLRGSFGLPTRANHANIRMDDFHVDPIIVKPTHKKSFWEDTLPNALTKATNWTGSLGEEGVMAAHDALDTGLTDDAKKFGHDLKHGDSFASAKLTGRLLRDVLTIAGAESGGFFGNTGARIAPELKAFKHARGMNRGLDGLAAELPHPLERHGLGKFAATADARAQAEDALAYAQGMEPIRDAALQHGDDVLEHPALAEVTDQHNLADLIDEMGFFEREKPSFTKVRRSLNTVHGPAKPRDLLFRMPAAQEQARLGTGIRGLLENPRPHGPQRVFEMPPASDARPFRMPAAAEQGQLPSGVRQLLGAGPEPMGPKRVFEMGPAGDARPFRMPPADIAPQLALPAPAQRLLENPATRALLHAMGIDDAEQLALFSASHGDDVAGSVAHGEQLPAVVPNDGGVQQVLEAALGKFHGPQQNLMHGPMPKPKIAPRSMDEFLAGSAKAHALEELAKHFKDGEWAGPGGWYEHMVRDRPRYPDGLLPGTGVRGWFPSEEAAQESANQYLQKYIEEQLLRHPKIKHTELQKLKVGVKPHPKVNGDGKIALSMYPNESLHAALKALGHELGDQWNVFPAERPNVPHLADDLASAGDELEASLKALKNAQYDHVAAQDMPKARELITPERVSAYMKQHPGTSAPWQIGHALGFGVNPDTGGLNRYTQTVQTILDELTAAGILHDTGHGAPALRYELTEKGRALTPDWEPPKPKGKGKKKK